MNILKVIILSFIVLILSSFVMAEDILYEKLADDIDIARETNNWKDLNNKYRGKKIIWHEFVLDNSKSQSVITDNNRICIVLPKGNVVKRTSIIEKITNDKIFFKKETRIETQDEWLDRMTHRQPSFTQTPFMYWPNNYVPGQYNQ